MTSSDREKGRIVRTAKGIQVLIRPVTPDDRPKLLDFVRRLSPETRYRRFHIPIPDPPPEELLRRVSEVLYVPPERGAALVAVHNGDIVGSAHYVRDPEKNTWAEAAVVVRDDFQGQGLGTRLLRELARHAAEQGIRVLYAYIQPDNERVLRIVRKAHFPLRTSVEQGLMRVDVLIHGQNSVVP
ncbi:MAG: GNAT family N-acetyltransferase [Chloroflexi bacterium]|nr:GNAT family N-acetyltransferase [Chloroflexota bacterium]